MSLGAREIMNIFHISCVLLVFFLLSGCIFLDITAQDTAVPLYPKKIRASMHMSNGVNISHTYY